MALTEQTQALLDAMNSSINLLVQERDRVRSLFSNTLPGETAVWDVLPQNIRDTLKSNATTNITTARDNLNGVMGQIGSF